MEDETTTNAATQDEAQTAQPPVSEQTAEAVQDTDQGEPTTTDQTDEGQSEPDQALAAEADNSDDLSDYWAKKGIDITTPEGQAQAAKSYREAEKKMHQTTQQASELEKQMREQPVNVNADDELTRNLATEVIQMKRRDAIREFRDTSGIKPEQEQAFSDFLVKDAEQAALNGTYSKRDLINAGVLSLSDAFTLSGIGAADRETIEKQGGQKALEQLANKQRAAAVTGSAVNTTPPAALSKENVDQWWDGLGAEGRADPANRAKLDSILAQ